MEVQVYDQKFSLKLDVPWIFSYYSLIKNVLCLSKTDLKRIKETKIFYYLEWRPESSVKRKDGEIGGENQNSTTAYSVC